MSVNKIREAIMQAQPTSSFPFGLRMDAGQVDSLKNNKLLAPLLQEIRQYAERIKLEQMESLPFSLLQLYELIGDRKAYEDVYFLRRSRLLALALATLLFEDGDYLSALEDTVWDICAEYTWCLPAHLSKLGGSNSPELVVDLFAAETAQTLAEVWFLLKHRMHPAVSQRIELEMERRVFFPMFHEPSTRLWWESVSHNWASVCAGCVGMAAMLLVDDRERLAGMLERVMQTMECFLLGYGADGGCAEGVSYWVYGFGYFVYYAEMLYDFTGGEINLLNNDKVRVIAAFPSRIYFSQGVFVNYSDAAEYALLPPGLLVRLSTRTGQLFNEELRIPGFHEDPCYRWAHLTRNLMWTDLSVFRSVAAQGSQWLGDLQWVIDRRSVNNKLIGFSAKGGHNNVPHNHNDLGHFIVHLDGRNILHDLGHGLYTKAYFADGRYDILNNSSAGHSVPVINGCYQMAGELCTAELLLYAEHPEGVDFHLDLTKAYPASSGLALFTRYFHWECKTEVGKASLIIEDYFRFMDGSATIEECFISCVQPVVIDEEIVWNTIVGKISLGYNVELFNLRIKGVHPQDHEGKPVAVYQTFLSREQTEAEMTYRFTFKIDIDHQ